MKKQIVKYSLPLMFLAFSLGAKAQENTASTLYFMENVAFKQVFNPAFQPKSSVVVGLPGIGHTSLGVWNNSLTLKDVIYKDGNQSIFFFHPKGDRAAFFNTLKNRMFFGTNMRVNLLSVGIKTNETDFWTFSASVRGEGSVVVPKSLMELALYGTKSKTRNNHFNLEALNFEALLFTDLSVGVSSELNDQWTVGAKASFLMGHAHTSMSNQNLSIDASIEQWHIQGEGDLRTTIPGIFVSKDLDSINFGNIGGSPFNGFGGAFDLGATYKPLEELTFSFALNDIGAIRWLGTNGQTTKYRIDYKYEGLHFEDSNNFKVDLDNLKDEIKQNIHTDQTDGAYFSGLSPKLNLGAEYSFFENKLSAGLLSRTSFYRKKVYEELTLSVNARPIDWFDFSLSYSILNGRGSNLGMGFGLRTGIIQWVFAVDYLPLQYAYYKNEGSNSRTLLPYNAKGTNFSFGINLVFGSKPDKDRDGVKDKYDLCPDTPRGVKVDEQGCPLDSDGDGVPDYLDTCPGTPIAARGFVDAQGCLLDEDTDGVPDYLDKCPGTPAEARGFVDEHGCPLDTDGDGVYDYLDKCPGTLPEARGFVDEHGCPMDTDGDGVPDYLDKCPDTPKEAKGFVDEHGCPLDTDGDGVPNYLDACPEVKGIRENNGCPEVKKEVKRLFQQALQGIQFETGSAVIKKSSNAILDKIVDVLINNPEYRVEIQGHTDNTGKEDLNLKLSDQRAASVRRYLIGRGVDADQISSKGYGLTRPVADNKTAAGRAKNRRVEFVVSFEKVVQE